MKKKSSKKLKTKEDVYFSYVRRGDDRCYAQWRADEWEKRQAKKGDNLMKTPEEMAKEYSEYLDEASDDYRVGAYEGFLAGYREAKVQDKAEWDAAHERMIAEYEGLQDSDTPDLQEQIEALQQYMTVAQRKIMALQANVEFLLYHNKEKIGESETLRRMQQTMQGFGRNNE